MKILFVEDELSKNIPRIIRLFSKYLGEERIQRLDSLEADEYGAEPEEIKAIVEETNLIELDYRFSDALRKIVQSYQDYALFIVDRNLSETEYDFKEVKKIDSAYTEALYERYFEREGDYLLYKLAMLSNADIVKAKFYYLTAYSADDEIRGQDDITALIEHFGDFKTQNMIEKGAIEKLKEVAENIPIMNLQYENRAYLDILRKNIGHDAADGFLKILEEKDEPRRIGDNFKEMRIIYESMLSVCTLKIPGMKQVCGDEKGGKTIIWLQNNQYIDEVILRNVLFSIRKISNEFGAHKQYPYKPFYEPTLNTVNSLVYALKDVILWFGKICRP